jgi:hypothetical protein
MRCSARPLVSSYTPIIRLCNTGFVNSCDTWRLPGSTRLPVSFVCWAFGSSLRIAQSCFCDSSDAMSEFDPRAFYRFANDAYRDNTLSCGIYQDSNGAINMTTFGSLSSENWQIYYQQGRYFIRNYDYGADWQLGLSGISRSVPRLMRRSGSLGQQWTLTRRDDGTWALSNGLLGNGSWLSLVAGNTVPGMQPSSTGASWDITINPSAQSPRDPDSFVDVNNFEVCSRSLMLGSS